MRCVFFSEIGFHFNQALRAKLKSRQAYNWALDEWQRLYALYKKDPENNSRPNEMLLRRRFNAIKRIESPYMFEVAKCAPQQAIRNIGKAYVNHWRDPNGMRV